MSHLQNTSNPFTSDIRCALQERDKRRGLIFSNAVIIKFHYKHWEAFGYQLTLGGSLLCRGPTKGHLTAKCCWGFVVEFNNNSITVEESMWLTSLLQGAPRDCCLLVYSSPRRSVDIWTVQPNQDARIGSLTRWTTNHISFPECDPKQEKMCQIKADHRSICDSRQHN